jgi:DNA-binding winged helix-turn-helix (wHTH) protein
MNEMNTATWTAKVCFLESIKDLIESSDDNITTDELKQECLSYLLGHVDNFIAKQFIHVAMNDVDWSALLLMAKANDEEKQSTTM